MFNSSKFSLFDIPNTEITKITIIIKGGYWETTNKGKFWRAAGYIGFRSADHLHRVDLKPNTDTMTIFIPGPFGLRKNKRADYKTNFKEKKNLG